MNKVSLRTLGEKVYVVVFNLRIFGVIFHIGDFLHYKTPTLKGSGSNLKLRNCLSVLSGRLIGLRQTYNFC